MLYSMRRKTSKCILSISDFSDAFQVENIKNTLLFSKKCKNVLKVDENGESKFFLSFSVENCQMDILTPPAKIQISGTKTVNEKLQNKSKMK